MLYVCAEDRFMSGWGAAKDKTDVYVVECKTRKLAKIAAENLRNRPEMQHVKTTSIKPWTTHLRNVSFAAEGHVYHTPGAIKSPVRNAEEC